MTFGEKPHTVFVFIFVMITAVLLFMPVACSNQTNTSTVDDAYDYPVKSGTDAWKALGSHIEMLQVCKIPETKLQTMSTAGMVETVLNYPLFCDAWAWNTPQEGFDAVSSQFNGLSELLKRDDAGIALLAKYKAMNPMAMGQDWTDTQQGMYVIKFMNIEMLLAQRALISNLNAAQCQDLVRELLTKIDAERQSEIYGSMSRDSCLWAIARVLEEVKYAPFMNAIATDSYYHTFVDEGFPADDNIVQDILTQAQEYTGVSAVKETGMPQEIKYISLENWLHQHVDSTDPTDIALIKYNQAIVVYRNTHPEYTLRSDWGVDYSGELKILTDLGVEGLPGLLKEADTSSPFVIPVIIAINEICKTNVSLISHFSLEEITLWKIAFNNKAGVASDVVAKVVQTLKNNSSINDDAINNQLATLWIFALPYFYNEIVNKSNDQLIPFASQVLPAAIMTEFDLQRDSNDKDKIISALKNCRSDIGTILSLAAQ